jgi:hypothetical protein
MPNALPPDISTISAAVVSTAMAMPTMPNMLPRMDVVGCDRPFKAWMKHTEAARYSSVTIFMLICALRQWRPASSFLSS